MPPSLDNPATDEKNQNLGVMLSITFLQGSTSRSSLVPSLLQSQQMSPLGFRAAHLY